MSEATGGRQVGSLRTSAEWRGFGFVHLDGHPPAGRSGVFLHFSELPRGCAPREGLRLAFRVVDTPKGARAADVEVLEDQAPAGSF